MLLYCYFLIKLHDKRSKWKKVTDHSPRPFKNVLIKCKTYAGKTVVTEGNRIKDNKFYSHRYKFIKDVTHYMELPR